LKIPLPILFRKVLWSCTFPLLSLSSSSTHSPLSFSLLFIPSGVENLKASFFYLGSG
jgi:hypothetical protein